MPGLHVGRQAPPTDENGEIDRAASVARGTVRDAPDHWMPVLFSRLKSGRLWYVPGFGGGTDEFEHWDTLRSFVGEKRCTPVIGPGVAEAWLGAPRDIARRWAAQHGYPFAPDQRDSLPRVAQYLAGKGGEEFLDARFRASVRDQLAARSTGTMPSDDASPLSKSLLTSMKAAINEAWTRDPREPHRLLARLRLPIYVTTSPCDLLAEALRAEKADPQVRLCPWWRGATEELSEDRWQYDDEPTPEKPLVYHLYGHLDTPAALVLSEDQYFDFLIGFTRNRKLIPDTVLNALTGTALLFLGFAPDEWPFRVLFRTLMAQGGSERFRRFRHVTAQVAPDEGRLLDQARARRYLESTFQKDQIAMYWGRTEEFLADLADRLAAQEAR